MRRVTFGTIWAVLLAIICMVIFDKFACLLLPSLTATTAARGAFALPGLAAGLGLFLWLQQRGSLPGLRDAAQPLTARRVLSGALWFIGFTFVGLLLGGALEHKVFPGLGAPPTRGLLPVCGVAAGMALFAHGANRSWLPGLRRHGPVRVRELKWGFAQAAWLTGGVLGMQVAGAIFCVVCITIITDLTAILRHVPLPPHGGTAVTVAAALDGYLTAALWSVWYINRLGPARVADPGPTGIAWRGAPRAAYGAAVLFAVLIVAVVTMLFRLFPPNLSALKAMPVEQIFGKPGWPVALLVILAVFIAPPVEEWVFRGGVFAALANRLSPLWAGIITTGLFMLAHAQDKIHYPPGFIDVGLAGAACAWLRVRFGSIRPGILLHVLYNAGAILAAGLFH